MVSCIEPTADYIDEYGVNHGKGIAVGQTILAYNADELINNRRAEIELLQRTSVEGGYSINGVTYYKIKEGDTLGGIAKKFRISVKQLKAWNGLKSDIIRALLACRRGLGAARAAVFLFVHCLVPFLKIIF